MKIIKVLMLFLSLPSMLYAHDYFAWQSGDQASYVSDLYDTEVKSEVVKKSRDWVFVKNFAGMGDHWVYGGASTGLFLYYAGELQQLPDHTFAIGDSRTVNLGGCQENVSVSLFAKGLSVSTAAGQFDDVIELDISGSRCRDAGVTKVWFAKGVGVIGWSSMNIQGPERFDLNDAEIGQVRYPMSKGIAISANFPHPKINLETQRTISAAITLTNHSSETLRLDFSSSQRFDIILMNAAGEAIHRLSASQVFLQVLGSEMIKAGKSITYSGKLNLPEGLKAGNYALAVEITTMGPAPRPTVSTPLWFD